MNRNRKIAAWPARLLIGLPVLLILLLIAGGFLFDSSGLVPYAGLYLVNGKPRYRDGAIRQNGHTFRYSIYDGAGGAFPELTIFDDDGKELITVGGNANSVIGMCDLNRDGRTDIYTFGHAHWPYRRHRILYYVDGEYRYLWDPHGGFRFSLIRFFAGQNLKIFYWFILVLIPVSCGIALTARRKRWSAWEITPLAILLLLSLLPLTGKFVPYPDLSAEEYSRILDEDLEEITYVSSRISDAEPLTPAPRSFYRHRKELTPLLIEKIGDNRKREEPLHFQEGASMRSGDAAHLALCALYRIDNPEWYLTGGQSPELLTAPFFDRFQLHISTPGNLEKLQRAWKEKTR